MKRSLLLVDDDARVRETVRALLASRDWDVRTATDGLEGLGSYERDAADVVVLDVNMPGISGLDVLYVLLERDPDASIVMLTGHGDVSMAVSAMQAGAENFLTKPVNVDHLVAAVERAWEKTQLRRQARRLARQNHGERGLSSLNRTPLMRELGRQVHLLAGGAAPVLLTGETGSGKGWLAQFIHAASPRASRPFVSINCAGLTATFLDTELFGHEKGAFTDAKHEKEGLFEVADGGTLFLDEIGDMAIDLQPKLLTALETGRFRRLGGTREREVDVRLIAATHHDLAAAAKAGRFREDLYYRLAVLPLHVPSLRERGSEEIGALASQVISDLCARGGRSPIELSPEAIGALTKYRWPGNIRELRNVLERAILLAGDASILQARHLPADVRGSEGAARGAQLDGDLTLDAAVRRHIESVLRHFDGNRLHAARALGIPRSTLYKRIGEFGLD